MHHEPLNLKEIHREAASQKSALMRRSSLVTISGVGFLITIKLIAWFMTGSLALMSSLVDSVMDMLASLLNFLAISYALVPPDNEHRFGHGKVEYISGLMQALFIATTAGYVVLEAISRFITPQPVEQSGVAIGVMVISIVVTLGMVKVQRHALKETDSTAVRADSVHYVMDVLTNGAVILGLLLVTYFDWQWADPLFALLVALYIIRGAWDVGYTSFQNLMDHEFDDEERMKIVEIVQSHPQVEGLHELKTRRSGILSFIQFHMDIDESLNFKDAHAVTEEVEERLAAAFPHTEILIHADPVKI